MKRLDFLGVLILLMEQPLDELFVDFLLVLRMVQNLLLLELLRLLLEQRLIQLPTENRHLRSEPILGGRLDVIGGIAQLLVGGVEGGHGASPLAFLQLHIRLFLSHLNVGEFSLQKVYFCLLLLKALVQGADLGGEEELHMVQDLLFLREEVLLLEILLEFFEVAQKHALEILLRDSGGKFLLDGLESALQDSPIGLALLVQGREEVLDARLLPLDVLKSSFQSVHCKSI